MVQIYRNFYNILNSLNFNDNRNIVVTNHEVPVTPTVSVPCLTLPYLTVGTCVAPTPSW